MTWVRLGPCYRNLDLGFTRDPGERPSGQRTHGDTWCGTRERQRGLGEGRLDGRRLGGLSHLAGDLKVMEVPARSRGGLHGAGGGRTAAGRPPGKVPTPPPRRRVSE